MGQANLLDVSIVTPQGILFEGQAQSITFPGEHGVFEVLINHRALLSRLIGGKIVIDHQGVPIRRGIVKVALNKVLAIVEDPSH